MSAMLAHAHGFLMLFLYPVVVHMLYAVIWLRPEVWFPRSSPQHRVWHFRNLAYGKQVVFFACLPYYLTCVDPGLAEVHYSWRVFALASKQPGWQLVAACVLLVSGLVLEIAAFAAIGENAILYGCKFGMEVTWVTDKFPYTWISHPQHIGISLSFASIAFFFGWDAGLPVSLMWLALYLFQTLVESTMAQEQHQSLKKAAAKSS